MEHEPLERADESGALGLEVGDHLGAFGSVDALCGGQAVLGVLEQFLEHVAPQVRVRLERCQLGRAGLSGGCRFGHPGDLGTSRDGVVGCDFLGGSVGHGISGDVLQLVVSYR